MFIPAFESLVFLKLGNPHAALYLKREELNKDYDDQQIIFLGEINEKFYFTYEVDKTKKEKLISSEVDVKELVYFTPLLSKFDSSILSFSRSLVLWHHQNKFCGVCGSKTKSIDGGFARICTNEECKKVIFPRVDPSIIVLIYHEDKCLLGRQERWPEGMYSTIAGFVELGESLKSCLEREVYEETGLNLKNIQYKYSDPWPFPGSLMLGYFAEAKSTKLNIDRDELDDCRWFTREELTNAIKSKEIRLPLTSSISFRLINEWMNNE